MAHRLSELIREYRRRPAAKAEQSLWAFVAERDPHVFSHHPPDPGFREHVWKIRGLYFCKGCLMTAAGMGFGALFFALTRWLYALETSGVAVAFVLLLAPTAVAHLFDLPRPLKHVSRFLLGVLIVSAICMLFVTDSWWVRLAIIGTYFAAKIPLEGKRLRMNRRIERRSKGSGGE